ncbi:c-type cytochrome [Phenylobacterium sp.]|jgi:cytochrome c|uniref:c-type cytochrome n=1 Tax=Phenylobacterium sp. TaxID=1871053 RepID=UPI0037C91D30
MSELTFNKIAGAALATGLAIIGLGQLSAGVFGPEKPAKPGYLVEVAEEGGGGAVVEMLPDWGTVLPTADIEAGKAVFAKCSSCHTIAQGGANGTGPAIWGVEGRKPGSHAGFAYSKGMAEFGAKQAIWDYDSLYEFIKAPAKYMPGTKMTFVGLKKPEDRVNVIAYMKSQGGTLPIPAPDPSRAPGAAAAAAAPATTAPAATDAAAPASAGAPAAAEAPAAAAPAVPAKK